jgi:hypothetical protein
MHCPVCDEELPPGAAAEAHVNAHFDGGGGGAFGAFGATPGRVACDACGASVAAGEADSHALAHALQAEEARSAQAATDAAFDFVDLTGDDEDAVPRPALGGQQQQRLLAQQQRALAAAAARMARPLIPLAALPGAQAVEAPPAEPDGLHGLLRAALLAQPPARGFLRAALAAPPLLHYATADGVDAGCAGANFNAPSAFRISAQR